MQQTAQGCTASPVSCFSLDDDYHGKNVPAEAEELSFEVSYSEMVTEMPDRNKWKKSDIKKEDYVLTVSTPLWSVQYLAEKASVPT